MKKWLATALMFLGMVVPSLGQTVSFVNNRGIGTFPGFNHTTQLIPISNGQVRVCQFGAIGSPCSPVATDITDLTGTPLTIQGGNFGQVTTDIVGRYAFGCTSGVAYMVQEAQALSNNPMNTYLMTCPMNTTAPIVNLSVGNLSATTGLAIPDGTTCATPSFFFTNETNTGMTRVSANNIGWCVGGTQRMQLGTGQLTIIGGSPSLSLQGGSGLVSWGSPSDVTIGRINPGVLGINNAGTLGTGGALQAAQIGIGGTPANKLDITGGGNSNDVNLHTGLAASEGFTVANSTNTWNFGLRVTTNQFIIRTVTGAVDALALDPTTGFAVFSGGASFGSTPAQSGQIRLPNNTSIAWRNAANTVDLTGITGTSGNVLNLGFNNEIQTNGGITITVGAASRWIFSSVSQSSLSGRSDGVLGFSSTTTPGTNATGYSPCSTNVHCFGNGTNGDFTGTIKATIANMITGFQVNGAATTGNVLRGNGTNFVAAVLAAADLSNGTTGSGGGVVLATGPTITAGLISAKNLNNIRFADQFAGADCGAKINAADADLGVTPGEIWVTQACGTSWTTAVTTSLNHSIRFFQGGTYTVSALITLGQSSCLIGIPTGSNFGQVTLQEATGVNLPVFVQMNTGQNCLRDIILDGNKANNPTEGVGVKVNLAPRTEFSHSLIQNFKSHGIWFNSTANQSTVTKVETTLLLNNDGNCLYIVKTADGFVGDETEMENCGLQQSGAPQLPTVNCTNATPTVCTWQTGPKWSTDSSLVSTQVLLNGVLNTVSSIGSTTSVTLAANQGTLTGVTLQWGGAVEMNNGNAWRFVHDDFGLGAAWGVRSYCDSTTNGSSNNIFTSNQFANVGPDMLLDVFDSTHTAYCGRFTSIVGNQFVGNTSSFGATNTFNSIQIQDGGGEVIEGNLFQAQQGALPARARAILVNESLAGRDQPKVVNGNVFQGTFGTAPITCNTTNGGASCILSGNAGLAVNEIANVSRVRANLGTPLVAGDFSLNASWGNTASATTIAGTDSSFNLVVTSAGTGQAPNPIVTLTFHDGTWTNAPICTVMALPGTGALNSWTIPNGGTSATSVQLQMIGTPAATLTYQVNVLCQGKGN